MQIDKSFDDLDELSSKSCEGFLRLIADMAYKAVKLCFGIKRCIIAEVAILVIRGYEAPFAFIYGPT